MEQRARLVLLAALEPRELPRRRRLPREERREVLRDRRIGRVRQRRSA